MLPIKMNCPLNLEQRRKIWWFAHSLKINLEWEGGNWISLNEINDEDAYFVGTYQEITKELILKMNECIKDGEQFATFEKHLRKKDYLIIALNHLRQSLKDFEEWTDDLFKKGE